MSPFAGSTDTFYCKWNNMTIRLHTGPENVAKTAVVDVLNVFSEEFASKVDGFPVPASTLVDFAKLVLKQLDTTKLGYFVNLFLDSMRLPKLNYKIGHGTPAREGEGKNHLVTPSESKEEEEETNKQLLVVCSKKKRRKPLLKKRRKPLLSLSKKRRKPLSKKRRKPLR